MVLSNKKLKQKLREELARSLSISSATGSGPNDNKPKPETRSLKELLDTVSHTPRLTKREKRRKTPSLGGLASSSCEIRNKKEVESVVVGENGGRSEESKKRKRKRDDNKSGELDVEEEGDGVVKEEKKMRKKKKKKKKKKTTKKKVEENEGVKVENEEPGFKETHVTVDSPVEGVVPRKIYVGGIPYHCTEDEIRSYFKGCGAITEVDCIMRSEDGKFSGIAFITFENEDAANRALALDRAAMGDCFLTIQQYVKTHAKRTSDFTPEVVEGYNRIYVGNLSWDITEHDIRSIFSDCVITSLRMGTNKETGEFKGYAHVDFKDGVSMAMAMKLDQQIVRGRPIRITRAVPKKGANTDSNPKEADNAGVYKEETNIDSISWAVTSEATDVVARSAVSSGKLRTRKCYECGEKGHLSSACPKNHNADNTN